MQLQEPYKAALTPKYLIPATLREIHNPYFTILKSITTFLRCKILKPTIKRIEPGTWATSCTWWLIFQRVLQSPFVGFMENFSESLACFGDSTVFKHDLTAFKEPVEFGHCTQDFNQQSHGHDGPKAMIQEVEYQNSILCSGFGATWNSTI